MRAAKRILLVEDEPGLVLTLTDRLEAESYSVDAVSDGDDAVDKATFATWASAQKAQLADLDRRLSSSIAHSSAISAKLSERVTVRSRLSKPTQQPPDARGSHG